MPRNKGEVRYDVLYCWTQFTSETGRVAVFYSCVKIKMRERLCCVHPKSVQSLNSSNDFMTREFFKGNLTSKHYSQGLKQTCLFFTMCALGMGTLTCYGTLLETEGHLCFSPTTRCFPRIQLSLLRLAACALIH